LRWAAESEKITLIIIITSICVCNFRYLAQNARVSCCHLWPARLCYIYSHYLINSMIFVLKKVIEHKSVLIFCTTFVETFLILSRIDQDMIKNVHWCSCKVLIILVRF
jgi:hypothetical protein